MLAKSDSAQIYSIPDDFYYEDDKNTMMVTEWSRHGPGKLNYSKAIRNLPCFKKTRESGLTPRPIILTDWTGSIFHPENQPVIRFLRQLLNKGFKIFIHKNYLTRLTLEALSNIVEKGIFFPCDYISPEILQTQAAMELNILPQHLLLLDAFELIRLSRPETNPDWTLSIRDLYAYVNKKQRAEIINDFIRNTSRPQCLLFNMFSAGSFQILSEIMQEIPDIKVIFYIEKMVINDLRQIHNIINNQDIHLEKGSFHHEELGSITSLTIKDISFKNIRIMAETLRFFPQLNKLVLKNITIQDQSLYSIKEFPQITQVEIHNSPLNSSLVFLILNATGVNNLIICHCDFRIEKNQVFSLPQLPQLQYLTIESCFLDTSHLAMFSSTCNLITLIINNNEFSIDTTDIPTLNNLINLEYKPSINTANFLQMFDLFKVSLKNLSTFTTCQLMNYVQLIKNHRLISGNFSDIILKHFTDLMTSFPKLTTFNAYLLTIDQSHFGSFAKDPRKLLPFCYKPIFPAPPQLQTKKILEKQIVNNEAKPTCPLHNAENDLTFKPCDGKFVFDPSINTKDQDMIVQKLSQYLTLQIQEKMYLIPEIQGGICAWLSEHFVSLSIETWNEQIEMLRIWNGKIGTLHAGLADFFVPLIDRIENPVFPVFFLGDSLENFLKNKKTACVFVNYNHRIAIKPVSENIWAFLNPNNPDGYFHIDKKDLPGMLRKHLGPLICVAQEKKPGTRPSVKNNNQFLREGGLQLLSQIKNAGDFNLPQPETLEDAALDRGLHIRDVDGFPAWLTLFSKNDTLAVYAFQLLQKFHKTAGKDFYTKLKNSVNALSPVQLHACIEQILKFQNKNPEMAQILCYILHTSPSDDYYLKKLRIWETDQEFAPDFHSWCSHLVQSLSTDTRPQLVILPNTEDLLAFSLQMENYCKNTGRPLIVPESVDDLICSLPFIKRQGDKGIPSKGPGGRMYDALMKHQYNKPFIIIPYYLFKSESEFIRFQPMLSPKNPHVDGTPLPAGTSILGLTDNRSFTRYAAHYKYFKAQTCPFSGTVLTQKLKQPRFVKGSPSNAYCIDLYQGSDWKEILSGDAEIYGNSFFYPRGEWQKAWESGLPILLRNPTRECLDYFKKAAARGFIGHDNEILPFPSDTILYIQENYDWKALLENTSWQPGLILHPDIVLLNPYEFENFFKRQELENTLPGYLKLHANQRLTVNLTRNLDMHSWGRFLIICQKFSVSVQFHCASGIALPDFIIRHLSNPEFMKKASEPMKLSGHTLLLTSTDMDATLYKLTRKSDDQRIIMNISASTPEDLLPAIDATFNEDSMTFTFKKAKQFLVNELAKNKVVILYGQFSPELRDALIRLVIERNINPEAPGNLILLSDKAPIIPGFMHAADRNHADIKKECFGSYHQLRGKLEKTAFTLLRAQATWLNQHPEGNPEDAFSGLVDIPPREELPPFDIVNCEENTRKYIQEKLDTLLQALKHQRFVILTGISGVGKTTTILEYLLGPDRVLFQGLENLHTCLKDQSGKQRIFFQDEANMIQTDMNPVHALTILEGLMHNPPGIKSGDDYIYLREAEIWTILSLNPLAFGGNRISGEFLKRHGNCLLLKPLPPDLLYVSILKPVFSKTAWESAGIDISRMILEAYVFIYHAVIKEIAISPRELQMMALMTLSWLQNNSRVAERNPEIIQNVAKYFIYQLMEHAVPEKAMPDFQKLYKPDNRFLKAPPPKRSDFLLTPSRIPAWLYFNNWVNLHKMRLASASTVHRTGGLGGIIFQGPSKIGKFSLVKAMLDTHGYVEIFPEKPLPANKLRFCIIEPGSEIIEEKYLFAFHMGAIAIVKKMDNALEYLLNALLMGKTPDGSHAKNPGFMIVVLQHFSTASPAIGRRTSIFNMKEDSREELIAKIMHKGLDIDIAASMVNALIINQDFAKKNHKTLPDFFHLETLAQEQLQFPLPPICKQTYELPLHREEAPAKRRRKADTFFQEPPENNAPENPDCSMRSRGQTG